jgi:hypothetical protein
MSTAKSNSGWLDRLRSSKGISSVTETDLETFLTCNSPDTNTKVPDFNPKSTADYPQSKKEIASVMSNVLAELFCMGDSNDVSRIKASRKQQNPRICFVSNSGDVALTVTKLTDRDDAVNVAIVDCEEEEKFPADLSGFSRTEVTVIDTSFSKWKFDKVLYRRKNVWKARDKKGNKPLNVGRKKRKLNPLMENDNAEKKGRLSSSNGDEKHMQLNAKHYEINKMQESDQETHQKRLVDS